MDPTTRRVILPGKNAVLLTDTVGFIQKLPTQLVAAFRATLEEITTADLLIHVVDITHPAAIAQWQAVQNTLKGIGAGQIPTITALNKIDSPHDPLNLQIGLNRFENAVAISAKTGNGLNILTDAVEKHLFDTFIPISVNLPYTQGNLISLFHQQGQIDSIEHGHGKVTIKGSLPGRLLVAFQPFLEHSQAFDDEEI